MADSAADRRSLRPSAAADLRALGVQVITDLDARARRAAARRARLVELATGRPQ